MTRRFLPLSEVCEILSISSAQGYALVRSQELPAIQIGGRGQWRVEASVLEEFIAGKYAEQRDAARQDVSGVSDLGGRGADQHED